MDKPKKKRVSIDEKKQALLNELRQVRDQIIEAAKAFDPKIVDQPFVGHWSIKELLAHLAGWDLTNKQAAIEILQGKIPAFYAHRDKDWASYNASLISKHKKRTLDETIAAAEDTHKELLTYLEELSAEDIFKDYGVRSSGYKVIIGRLLEVERKDEIKHLQQIKGFLEESRLL